MEFTSEQFINLLGGTTKVSKMCGTTAGAVSQWKSNGIPKDKLIFLALSIEKQTKGLVTRKSLFPKTYHLIWQDIN